MSSQRCSVCNIDWPPQSVNSKCPVCDQPTWFSFNQDAISVEEANQRIAEEEARRARIKASADKYAAFKEYCRERDERKAEMEVAKFREELDTSLAW